MNKNERTHGDEMASMGELHSLYKVKIMINKMINRLEATVDRDKKGRDNGGDENMNSKELEYEIVKALKINTEVNWDVGENSPNEEFKMLIPFVRKLFKEYHGL